MEFDTLNLVSKSIHAASTVYVCSDLEKRPDDLGLNFLTIRS